ncbi:MAG TPA: SCP2 sterol-binding domain-containing protein [Acidimicrobiales bacterium]|nr:SCP2 sterol-binding domain-containing protein [Acidimicrobiales bacterium]
MSEFLSEAWFAALGDTLRAAGPPPADEAVEGLRYVVELIDGPTTLPQALTFAVNPDGVSVSAGNREDADAVIAIDYDDALALANGSLTAAHAVRDGRLKIRGDVHGLVPLLEWLLGARSV